MPVLELSAYILEQKSLGWSIVGIEQATTSVSLDKFEFPKNTILLLGKEKEGIPAGKNKQFYFRIIAADGSHRRNTAKWNDKVFERPCNWIFSSLAIL